MTAARVTFYDEAKAFAAAVIAPIGARAVVNNVFLGVVERMVATPEQDHLRAAVWVDDALVLGVLRTSPYSLNLAQAGRGLEGVEALADALVARGLKLTGVGGESAIAEAFAANWTHRTGVRADGGKKRLLYQAGEIVPPTNISGQLKPAARANLARHVAWESAFAIDVNAPLAQREPTLTARRVEGWLDKGVLFDWTVEGKAVGHGVVLPIGKDGARVLAIYTPPDERSRSYAQAMTAALTQRALDQGRWCTLFTDADNAITNKIYQRIGYRLVTAFSEVTFGA